MKSKNPKNKPSKRLLTLKHQAKQLKLDLEAFADEHDTYAFASDKEVVAWLHSLPIESLSESLRKDRNQPRTRLSLQDLKIKNDLKKKYNEIKDELENLLCQIAVESIEQIEKQIKNI